MIVRVTSLLLIVGFVLIGLGPANADLQFGKDETVHFLEDVKVKGPAGEALFLGYKTTSQFFLAGIYIEDDGYVLGIRSDHSKYFALPAGDQLKGFQSRGLLPDPLPPYTLGFFDYLFGYSLWLVLAFLLVWYLFDWVRKRRAKAEPVEPVN